MKQLAIRIKALGLLGLAASAVVVAQQPVPATAPPQQPTSVEIRLKPEGGTASRIAVPDLLALSSDRGTMNQKVDQGYGIVCDISGNPVDGLVVGSTNQEHGIIKRRDGGRADCARFPVGTLLRILPNHACATAAPHERYFVVNGDLEIVSTWPRFNGW